MDEVVNTKLYNKVGSKNKKNGFLAKKVGRMLIMYLIDFLGPSEFKLLLLLGMHLFYSYPLIPNYYTVTFYSSWQ